jgi:hypothetical protein
MTPRSRTALSLAPGFNPCDYSQPASGCLNPEGIPSFSPGLRVGELPWVGSKRILFNPEMVAARAVLLGLTSHDRCFNPFSVGESLSPSPRVARPSQPWAECSNPFRIEETARHLEVRA